MSTVVVLNSGGLDSVVLLGELTDVGHEVHSLFVNYGQGMLEREQRESGWFADQAGVATHQEATVRLPGLSSVGYIPARNTWLLALAVAHAENLGAETVYAGFRGDRNVLYGELDQSPKYVKQWNKLMRWVVGKESIRPKIIAPLVDLTTVQVMTLGYPMFGDALLRTTSCAVGTYFPCEKCEKCVGRAEAIELLQDEMGWFKDESHSS